MKVKVGMEKAYEEYKDVNSKDEYSNRIVGYAEDWANLMEKEIDKIPDDPAHVINQCARATSSEADTDGITGLMYGCAAAALAALWEYGEILRLWHNLDQQIHNEGERANAKPGAVLNPALLTIKGDDNG